MITFLIALSLQGYRLYEDRPHDAYNLGYITISLFVVYIVTHLVIILRTVIAGCKAYLVNELKVKCLMTNKER